MNQKSKWLAHSANRHGKPELLCCHLRDVAKTAAGYAEHFGGTSEAYLAGLLHDLGKYSRLFQRRLEGLESGIDHWSAGAWVAHEKYKQNGIAAALSIQGHHLGLQRATRGDLRAMDAKKLSENHPDGLRIFDTGEDLDTLLARLSEDGLTSPPSESVTSILNFGEAGKHPVAAMLDVRMVYAALVDADFVETEAHVQANAGGSKEYRELGPPLEPEKAFNILEKHLEKLAAESKAASHVNEVRQELLDSCVKAAGSEPGLFTLTAPTGAGKTLSMLAFALRHAHKHGLRRVVMVIPYLSIIEQTVQEYRKILDPHFGTDYILEDHSLAGAHSDDKVKNIELQEDVERQTGMLAQNWDAPIVITTSVQILESLFSNRSSACRKLHRLAKSVILFDEVQTLPTSIIVPTLAAISHLSERYGSSIVFATATQPAFTHLDKAVRDYCAAGWNPTEIVPPDLDLFTRSRRTKIEFPDHNQKLSWSNLADEIGNQSQSLCIVNLKRHAETLFDELDKRDPEGLFHLSTNMCPAHRKCVLDEVRQRLNDNQTCRLVSTQCVEAGVDVDFPAVFRALGPLDSIAQAAGRCNRNGRNSLGKVIVFQPDDEDGRGFPSASYAQAADVTRIVAKRRGFENLDINHPDLFEEYYRELYDLSTPEEQRKELIEAIKRLDFVETAKHYRVIDKNTVNVLVCYDRSKFAQLKSEAEERGLNRDWIKRARAHTIGMFKFRQDDEIQSFLLPVPLFREKDKATDWFIYLKEDHYHEKKGLVLNTKEIKQFIIA